MGPNGGHAASQRSGVAKHRQQAKWPPSHVHRRPRDCRRRVTCRLRQAPRRWLARKTSALAIRSGARVAPTRSSGPRSTPTDADPSPWQASDRCELWPTGRREVNFREAATTANHWWRCWGTRATTTGSGSFRRSNTTSNPPTRLGVTTSRSEHPPTTTADMAGLTHPTPSAQSDSARTSWYAGEPPFLVLTSGVTRGEPKQIACLVDGVVLAGRRRLAVTRRPTHHGHDLGAAGAGHRDHVRDRRTRRIDLIAVGL